MSKHIWRAPPPRSSTPRGAGYVFVVALMLPLGCGGSDKGAGEPAAKPSNTTRPTSGVESGAAPLVLTPVVPAAPPVSPGRTVGPKVKPSAPAPSGGGPVTGGGAPSPANPGVYLMSETGLTKVRGCLTLDQPPPNPTKLTVSPAAGARQHFERDERDPLGNGVLTGADVEYRPEGIYLTNLHQTQTLLLSSLPADFELDPPVLLVPASGKPGQTWTFKADSKDGQVHTDNQNRIDAVDDPVTLGNGRVVQATKITTTTKVTGQSAQGTLDLTRVQTTWYAPAGGLTVKEKATTTGRIGLCELDSHSEATLQAQ